MTEPKRKIPYGELIAFAALIVSALGVWIAWKATNNNQPTRVVEQRQPIPMTLRGKIEDGGRQLVISPVESTHALESLTVTIPGAYPMELGSDGTVDADTVEGKLTGTNLEKGAHSVAVTIKARYVELGKDRTATGRYMLRYQVESGGLLGGRSLRLVGLSR